MYMHQESKKISPPPRKKKEEKRLKLVWDFRQEKTTGLRVDAFVLSRRARPLLTFFLFLFALQGDAKADILQLCKYSFFFFRYIQYLFLTTVYGCVPFCLCIVKCFSDLHTCKVLEFSPFFLPHYLLVCSFCCIWREKKKEIMSCFLFFFPSFFFPGVLFVVYGFHSFCNIVRFRKMEYCADLVSLSFFFSLFFLLACLCLLPSQLCVCVCGSMGFKETETKKKVNMAKKKKRAIVWDYEP